MTTDYRIKEQLSWWATFNGSTRPKYTVQMKFGFWINLEDFYELDNAVMYIKNLVREDMEEKIVPYKKYIKIHEI